MSWVVTLTGACPDPIQVDYATRDGTAKAPDDYVAQQGTLTFQQGETTKVILVSLKGDEVWEPTETFFLDLTNPRGGCKVTLNNAVSEAFINRDEEDRKVGINDPLSRASELEGTAGSNMSVWWVVTLTGACPDPIQVDYATRDGTAKAPDDYAPTQGTVTFGKGDTTNKLITVSLKGDDIWEPTETFFVDLTNPRGGCNVTLNKAVGEAFINRDEEGQGP